MELNYAEVFENPETFYRKALLTKKQALAIANRVITDVDAYNELFKTNFSEEELEKYFEGCSIKIEDFDIKDSKFDCIFDELNIPRFSLWDIDALLSAKITEKEYEIV